MRALKLNAWLALACGGLVAASSALAQTSAVDDRHGKLLLTGGVASVDGAAGGGLTPWALTGTYAGPGEWGASGHYSRLATGDYTLQAAGVAASWNDRVEVSLARQDFDTGATGTALGLPGLHLKLDVLGVKVRVAGEAVLDSDNLMPQVAVGVQHKQLHAGGLALTLDALGADRSDTEVYVSATKLLLGQGLLLNATLRATRANQNGLLGFGGTGHRSYALQPEISVAWLLQKNVAVGLEYRFNPDNLNPSLLGGGLKADDWKDVFVAWAPSKQMSFTAAWVDLGRVVPAVTARRQRGLYLSAQLTP
ncbi:MAG: hypothetical protein CFE46_13480 [Burkholderiales bacterium PBB6]|nr:MAG: hypothetical protein CFE46_13480 [Burkholderiales bacterium PBB6]